ncbi:MAG: hypothetical protein ABI809_06420 [Caldimonas sp.]
MPLRAEVRRLRHDAPYLVHQGLRAGQRKRTAQQFVDAMGQGAVQVRIATPGQAMTF